MQMEIIFECLCVSGISHSFLALKGTNMSLFVCDVPHPATCPTTYPPPHLYSCFWLRCLWTGTRWRLNAVEWAWLKRTYCRCSSCCKVYIGTVYRYVYSVVYQSGCDNLIFNSENDGCYIIIVAQRYCWLLCCGSCALPSVLLKFLPKYYTVLLGWFQNEAENKHDWKINCVLSQNRSRVQVISG